MKFTNLFYVSIAAVMGCVTAMAEDMPKGPHGGRLLESEGLRVELSIVEDGTPPEFRAWVELDGEPVDPDAVTLAVETGRLGGARERFAFVAQQDYLRATTAVAEPHSFDLRVTASVGSRSGRWDFPSYEGRTTIPERVAQDAGVRTARAGPRLIREVIEVTATVQANPARLANVRPRYAGVITEINVDVDQEVKRGQQLGVVETNESLRRVPITAPIGGLVVNRDVQVGQVTGMQPLFTIIDLSEVWVILDIFGSDLARVRSGMPVEIITMQGDRFEGQIDHVSPLMAHGSQTAHARVTLANPEGVLRSGQFVRGRVFVSSGDADVAVTRGALQTFRNFDVVYEKVGETFEVRMLKLGRRDDEFVEVLGGLEPGAEYVAQNSYLIKADIEKDGASHDH